MFFIVPSERFWDENLPKQHFQEEEHPVIKATSPSVSNERLFYMKDSTCIYCGL